MASKKAQLLATAKTRAPQAKPERLTEAKTQKQGFRIVPMSLYTDEADFVDTIAKAMKEAGNRRANRSMVMQGAIRKLMQELKGKSEEEITLYFMRIFKGRQETASA